MTTLAAIMVPLTTAPLRGGRYQLLMRLRGDDKNAVDTAATALGMTQADFMRVMAVNGAREVLSQLGIQLPAVTHQTESNTNDQQDTDVIDGAGDGS